MKILTLFMLMSSLSAQAYDWQYTITNVDGSVETKQVFNSENFKFYPQNYVCTLSPAITDASPGSLKLFDLTCLAKLGVQAFITAPKPEVDSATLNSSLPDMKGNYIKVELTCFHKLPAKK